MRRGKEKRKDEFMIIPYSTDTFLRRWPISNFVIILLCVLVFIAVMMGSLSISVFERMILSGWSPAGLLGHQFLHAGMLHLLFNMLYLWVFGNTVCDKMGNLSYAALFLLAGVFSAATHNVLDGRPAVGASGAINGVIGFYFVMYPVNKINCFYWFFFKAGVFEISGYWIILSWIILDAVRAFTGVQSGIAHWAHVGGFVFGVVFGILFLKARWVEMSDIDEPTLLDYLGKGNARNRSHRTRARSPGFAHSSGFSPVPGARVPAPAALPSSDFMVGVACPHCGQPLQLARDMPFKVFSCPHCRKEIELEFD